MGVCKLKASFTVEGLQNHGAEFPPSDLRGEKSLKIAKQALYFYKHDFSAYCTFSRVVFKRVKTGCSQEGGKRPFP